MGDVWTFLPQNTGERKHGDLHLLVHIKPCFHSELDFTAWLAKTGSDQVLDSLTPVTPPAATANY